MSRLLKATRSALARIATGDRPAPAATVVVRVGPFFRQFGGVDPADQPPDDDDDDPTPTVH
jgi:hypothetical protein